MWRPITPVLPGPSLEDFEKRTVLPSPNDHAYFLRVQFLVGPFTRFEEFVATVRWDDVDLPIDPGVLPSCDTSFVLPSTQTTGYDMTLTAAPYMAC